MSKDMILVQPPAAAGEGKILDWFATLSGVPEDRILDGLLLDDEGRPERPAVPLHEATWSFDPRSATLLHLDVGAWSIFETPILELRRNPVLLFEAILPEDLGVLKDLARIAMLGGELVRDYRLRRSDGNIRWIRAHAVLVRGHGDVSRVDGVLQDVTDERQRREDAEMRLRRVKRQRSALEKLFKDDVIHNAPLDQALRRVTELAAEGVDTDQVSIWFIDEEAGRLDCRDIFDVRTFDHINGLRLDIASNREYVESFERNRILAVGDVAEDDRVASLHTAYHVPLKVDATLDAAVIKAGRVVGIVKHEHRGGAREWLAEERAFVGRIADQVSHLLERSDRHRVEHDLTLYHACVEQAATGMIICDVDGTVLHCNDAFARMLDRDARHIVGSGPDLFLGEEAERTVAWVKSRLEDDDQSVETEMTYYRRNGEPFPVMVTLCLIHEPRSDNVFISGTVTDITDRIEARRALVASEERYREFFDNMNAGVAVYEVVGDGEAFVFKDYNEAGSRMDGVRRDDVIGRDVRDCFPGVEEFGLLDVFRRVWRTGDPERKPMSLYNDGNLVSWRTNDVYRLPNGDIVAVYEDATDKVKAEQALRLKQMSIDLANDAMIWTVRSGALIDANDRACELYDLPREELLKRTIFDLTTAHTRQSWAERWRRLRKAGSMRSESWHQGAEGRIFPVEISTRFLELEGQEYHCTIIRDQSDQKRQEAEIQRMNEELERRVEERTGELAESQDQLLQSEKMAALGRLVAGVTHEVNTPVGIGVTAASHLQDRIDATRNRYEDGSMKRSEFESFLNEAGETTRMILSNLDKALRLVQGFKGVAVDQSDGVRRIFALRDYLDEVLLSLRPRLKKTRITVDLDCPEALMVDSHPGALSQVLTNLVMNSVTHAYEEDEEGRISISVRLVGDDVEMVYVDDGRGMSADVARKIYEPFFTTKRGSGGSGLGMHVVYTSVTEVLGGGIDCRSVPDEGSTFTLRFPRERSVDDE